ncbi:c-type cytochrome [Methylotenera versatilis]|uniref:c-type cytochrome n=1 Tax=Methylotenera versatilis TaxID=1055487 RepID=UPI0006456343|nr:hypothetical protein [Methylotenera versatilis]
MINKKLVSSFILISSAALPILSIAAEDIVLSAPNLHIRTLAASCAACHGSNGNALAGNAVLAGMDKNHFITQMLAFKNGDKPATVMHRHAKGLQVNEINQLAEYFSAQKPILAISPKAQKLQADHD